MWMVRRTISFCFGSRVACWAFPDSVVPNKVVIGTCGSLLRCLIPLPGWLDRIRRHVCRGIRALLSAKELNLRFPDSYSRSRRLEIPVGAGFAAA